jgi:hypothetical protein
MIRLTVDIETASLTPARLYHLVEEYLVSLKAGPVKGSAVLIRPVGRQPSGPRRHEDMRRLRAEGFRLRDIADRCGVSEATASRACNGIASAVEI